MWGHNQYRSLDLIKVEARSVSYPRKQVCAKGSGAIDAFTQPREIKRNIASIQVLKVAGVYSICHRSSCKVLFRMCQCVLNVVTRAAKRKQPYASPINQSSFVQGGDGIFDALQLLWS